MTPPSTALPNLRVAMYINSLQRGGAETQFLRVARALEQAGAQVRIHVILPDNDFSAETADLDVRVLASKPGLRTFVGAWRESRAWQPHVVLSFLYQATLVARISVRAASIRARASSMRNERLESRARTLLYRATGRVDDVVVANSPRSARSLERNGTVRRGTLRVIPNGLDVASYDTARRPLRAELGIDDDTFLFLGVGRLSAQKDWPNLLRAVAGYVGRRAHFAIAGDGELRKELGELIGELALGDRVTLLGLRNDVPDLLASCDALVLSSRYEGLPNVVLEAMAAGRLVIATDVGGCSELVRPDSGFLVEPRSSDALAAALQTAADLDPATRAAMGTAARARVVSTYSLDGAGRAWVALIAELVERTSS